MIKDASVRVVLTVEVLSEAIPAGGVETIALDREWPLLESIAPGISRGRQAREILLMSSIPRDLRGRRRVWRWRIERSCASS